MLVTISAGMELLALQATALAQLIHCTQLHALATHPFVALSTMAATLMLVCAHAPVALQDAL